MKPDQLWYKSAIIYCLDVETFFDSNGDGVGDFAGLIRKLDYLASLGVNCLWLLPFYPSPNRDNGYDVVDYYGVDSRLGTLGDFVEFTHQAHEHGMRVLIDLVVNHTSDQHPWFQAAKKDRNSPYHDYYVWSDKKPKDADEGMVFPGVQETTWTYVEEVDAYYFHRFYEHQPDLNISNPAVQEEIRKIMGFWLQLGVSGFRVDAAPFLIELKGIEDTKIKDPYQYLKDLRFFLSWRRGDAIMLAEANVTPNKIDEYFGDGDKLHMLFNFMLNQHLFLALGRQETKPLIKGIKKLPQIPAVGQWANFLRNHDELDLGRLSDKERHFVFSQFGPEENMQLYQRGIRRRLAPMLDGDLRRIKLAYSLLFSLPGTPVLWYGQEIGMGDDLSLDERNSVRTPMQWSDEKNGGFSISDSVIRPVISEGDYGYQKINVTAQDRDPGSLLNWMRLMIQARRGNPEPGYGEWCLMETDEPAVFAHRCIADHGTIIAVHNLADHPVTVTFDKKEYEHEHWLEIVGDHRYQVIEEHPRTVPLDPYGYRWFRVEAKHPPAG